MNHKKNYRVTNKNVPLYNKFTRWTNF